MISLLSTLNLSSNKININFKLKKNQKLLYTNYLKNKYYNQYYLKFQTKLHFNILFQLYFLSCFFTSKNFIIICF